MEQGKIEKLIQNIATSRAKKGYTYENMAHELSITPAAYRKIETGKTKLTVERLFRISRILNVAVPDLLEIGGYFCYFLPRFLYSFFSSFPSEFATLIKQIAIGVLPSFQTIYSLFSQIIFFLFSLFMLYSIFFPFVRQTVLNIKANQVTSKFKNI